MRARHCDSFRQYRRHGDLIDLHDANTIKIDKVMDPANSAEIKAGPTFVVFVSLAFSGDCMISSGLISGAPGFEDY